MIATTAEFLTMSPDCLGRYFDDDAQLDTGGMPV